MKTFTHILTLTAITLLFYNCGNESKNNSKTNLPTVSVTLSNIKNNTNSQFLSVSGKIQATNSADLSTRTMGHVTKVHVNVGDNVKKGQLLISINNTDLQAKRAQTTANIAEASVAYANAQKDYNRFKNLFADQSASQKEFDDITARFEMAKARLEAANQLKNEVNAQFAYSDITAPFNGIITSKNIETGDMATPGIPLISLETPGNFEVIAMVPETEISQIKKGTMVDVLIKSINKTLKGTVSEVSSSAKNTGGQFLVKINLDSTEGVLSGMFTTVQFPVEKKAKTDMVLVPTEALVNKGQLTGIYTVSESNTAILRWLRLGRTFGNQVEVLSGLNNNEAYIISADGKLFNGAKIKHSITKTLR